VSHPKVHNHTPFAFSPMFLADKDGQPLFVPLLKATYSIDDEAVLRVAEQQRPVVVGGEFWGPPESSSYKFEPEGVVTKPATDVVLIGHAYPERPGDLETTVGLRVGSVRKLVQVVGDRYWIKAGGLVLMTSPEPFERVPLQWERAFGGWDRSAEDARNHRCEARNPVGTGFRLQWNDQEPRVRLPNLEHRAQRIQHFDDRPEPVGFGFVAPNWQPRAALAGTYDAGWVKSRMPLLPADFDVRFLNAAPPDQIVAGYLRGDEEMVVLNASPRGRLGFLLPGTGVPRIEVELRGARAESLAPVLDTVIVDTDSHCVSLLWRAVLPVSDVPTDVTAVHIAALEQADVQSAPSARVA
jgi:hypothetical protein